MPSAPRFKIGDLVTVRRGTRDPDFPDIPLGGWTGTVGQMGDPTPEQHYLVVWNEFTQNNMHPVFRQRCIRDDLEIESMWLRESDLDPAPSQQPALEQPGELQPRPLRLDNPADRIRAALGLTSDDPLPEVNGQTLRRYHAYLNERLTFPLAGEFTDEDSDFAVPPLPVEILRLWPIEDLDPDQGLQAEVREGRSVFVVPLDTLVVRNDGRAVVLLQDYASWFLEWADQQDDDDFGEETQMVTHSFLSNAARWITYAGGVGACIGGVLMTLEQARFGFLVGAFLLGTLGYFAGSRLLSAIDLATGQIRRSVVGGLLATMVGAILGGILGTLAVAALGSIPGAIACNLLDTGLASLRIRIFGPVTWGMLGALLGSLVYAWILNAETALSGALIGAGVGAGGLLVLMIVAVVVVSLIMPDEPPPE